MNAPAPHDPYVANASARDLVRMVDADPNATPREIKMAEYLQRAIDSGDLN